MATRLLLARLADRYRELTGQPAEVESVGGVDAARRLVEGEAFDVAVLASGAVEKLVGSGHLVAGTASVVALSSVAAAVPAGRTVPDVQTRQELVAALMRVDAIGYSTGPSGTALLDRLERWGVLESLRPRLRQAAPGKPVAEMVAQGEVDIGFQQLSEMIHAPGVTLLTRLPAEAEIVTAFVAAVCSASRQPDAAAAFVDALCCEAAAGAKHAEGMRPPSP